jgi:hypothetical protein
MPVQYQSDPVANVKPMAQTKPLMMNQQPVTPGGLLQSTGNPNYTSNFNLQGPGSQQASSFGSLQAGMSPAAAGGGWSQGNANRTQWNTDYGPVDTGVDAFNQFADTAYNQGLSRLQPQMDASYRRMQQQMVAQGLSPNTAAGSGLMMNQARAESDMLNSLNASAQAQGLAAQNQYFGQEMANNNFGLQQANQNWGQESFYDNLDNQRGIAGMSAAASMAGSAASAAASRYAADQQNYRAGLNYDLGLQGLNEQGRQFNATDAYRNQGQDYNYQLGLLGAQNQAQQTGINAFLAQNGANQSWYGNVGSLLGQAPQGQFTPTSGLAQGSMAAGNNMAGAQASQNQALGQSIGSLATLLGGLSDVRTKKNIKKVDTVEGVEVFEFDYKHKPGRYRGVLAHLVMKTHPQAVKAINGIKHVLYDLLPVKMERIA